MGSDPFLSVGTNSFPCLEVSDAPTCHVVARLQPVVFVGREDFAAIFM